MKIILVGPMGSGKSTIGRLVAKELGFEFKDSDKEIEARSGADIPWIFDIEGEQGFRDRESAMIEELTALPDTVLATGGGAIMREENRRLLQSRGTVVYLKTSVAQQLQRTAKDRRRPLLQVDNPEKVLADLIDVRGPLYESVCDIVIHTDGRRPRSVAQEIVRLLRERDAH